MKSTKLQHRKRAQKSDDFDPIANIVIVSVIPGLEQAAILREITRMWPGFSRRTLDGETEHFEIKNSNNLSLSISSRAIYEAGNLSCAIETSNLVQRFKPRFVFLCGIAGNMNDSRRNLGDVIVSGSYTYRSYTRMSEGGRAEVSNLPVPPISAQMIALANRVFTPNAVDFGGADLPPMVGEQESVPIPELEIGKIFCWDLVLDCDETRAEIVKSDRDIRAVEMESAGFFRSIEAFERLHNHPMDGLVFRGLSDPASNKAAFDEGKKNWRTYAARNAARSMVELIDKLHDEDFRKQNF